MVCARIELNVLPSPAMAGIPEDLRHRMAAATLELPHVGPIEVWSLYLRCGEGLSKYNLELLATVGSLAATGGQVLLAGDFQVKPEVLKHSSFLEEF